MGAVRNCLAWRMGLLDSVCLALLVCLATPIKFGDDHHQADLVHRPHTFGQVDSNGDFGHFTVRRCVKIEEGGAALCKYQVHYDVPHDTVSLIGRGIKCITKQRKIKKLCRTATNMDNSVKINKKQRVDIEFKQHCVHIKHDLRGKVVEANILDSCHIVQGKGKGKGKGKWKGKGKGGKGKPKVPVEAEARQEDSFKWKGD